ncbi:hypothetical protein M8818_005682 [Zalaria obscura]|uniref:Uncharacterized protein n=1 Tax=Zalaria obscura TaxID=2024903 RepID=A0ACC3S9M5_9PEZI
MNLVTTLEILAKLELECFDVVRTVCLQQRDSESFGFHSVVSAVFQVGPDPEVVVSHALHPDAPNAEQQESQGWH